MIIHFFYNIICDINDYLTTVWEMLKNYAFFALEAGIDEAGRGCLAGPVTAAAVILPLDFKNATLNDSKKLSTKQRNFLREIIETNALAYGVAHVSPKKIDTINILQATFLAMHRALNQLKVSPPYLAVDGNQFKPYKKISHTCIVKGDTKYLHIAAASILAKTHRDELMQNLHKKWPMYNWKKNKGYPTAEHRRAIEKFGISVQHRSSFQLLKVSAAQD